MDTAAGGNGFEQFTQIIGLEIFKAKCQPKPRHDGRLQPGIYDLRRLQLMPVWNITLDQHAAGFMERAGLLDRRPELRGLFGRDLIIGAEQNRYVIAPKFDCKTIVQFDLPGGPYRRCPVLRQLLVRSRPVRHRRIMTEIYSNRRRFAIVQPLRPCWADSGVRSRRKRGGIAFTKLW
jgi:hypothetical protein